MNTSELNVNKISNIKPLSCATICIITCDDLDLLRGFMTLNHPVEESNVKCDESSLLLMKKLTESLSLSVAIN